MQEALKLVEQNQVESREMRILRNLISKGVTVKAIADEIGKSRSLLSSYLNGSYRSPKDEGQHIEVALRKYFQEKDIWDESTTAEPSGVSWIKSVKEIGTIETDDMKRVHGLLNLCMDECEMSLLISKPGLGKSFAIERYMESNEDVILVECDGDSTTKTMLVDIAESMGIRSKGSTGTLMNRITRELKKNPRLVIFDEADLLKHREAIEMIRRLYDKSKNIGVVLVGNMSLAERLITYATDNTDYARISDRIKRFWELEGLTEDEVEKFLANVNITDAAKKMLVDIGTKRGTRQLVNALGRLLEVTRGKSITRELVEELGQIVLSFNA